MASYNIVAARPKNASNHLKSQFRLYFFNPQNSQWFDVGWKSIGDVQQLMLNGDDVRTGSIINNAMNTGAAVELELRIARNGTNYKISTMPDQ